MSKQPLPCGYLLVDKPSGPTSHDITAAIKRLLKESWPNHKIKVGHTGTLDPFASGLLIVLVGSATRLASYTHLHSKRYQTTLRLGATSDTDDLNGQIQPHGPHSPPPLSQVTDVLESFRGPQLQKPPAYSAIKIAGERLYDLARRGKPINDIPPRPVVIHDLVLLDYNYPQLTIDVTCSTGTYIRSLGRDIGDKLNTGAYLTTLRRLAIGQFNLNQAQKIDQIEPDSLESLINNPADLVAHLPRLSLSDRNVAQLMKGSAVQGREVALDNASPVSITEAAVFNLAGQLIGIASYDPSSRQLSPRLNLASCI